jgi:hypothetical protein
LGSGSWQVTGIVTRLSGPESAVTCPTISFSLTVVVNGSALTATLGDGGNPQSIAGELRNGDYVFGGVSLPCLTTLSDLTLHGVDTNGDGVADQLSGSVSGMSTSPGGDVVYTATVQIAFTGVPDTIAPRLLLPFAPPDDLLDPIGGFTINVSKPLAPGPTLSMVGTPTIPLTYSPELNAFSTDIVLPFAGQWTLSGSGADLAGHPLDVQGTLKTIADPGIFPQDGFESELIAATSTDKITPVTGVGTLPAISGAHSLLIPAGAAVTFHLQRAAAEKHVRFSYRTFNFDAGQVADFVVQVGVIGAERTNAPAVPGGSAEPTMDTGDESLPKASGVQTLSYAIEGDGADVLLLVYAPVCFDPFRGYCSLSPALLIDDLRLE